MKNKKVIINVLLVLFILSNVISIYTIVMGNSVEKVNSKNLTIVETPDQKAAETPSQFKMAEPVIPEKPKGTNIALNKHAEENGHQDIYVARNATDGKITTYWEGKANSYPNIVTVDLEKVSTFSTIRIALNPKKIWSKRTQTFIINISDDGKNFKELLPESNYNFDPMTGNILDIKLDSPAKARFVQIVFTANTGATGGQIGELEIYSEN